MKTVSVVIPNYNNAHYLANAIQSVLNQTFTDYEIIVVDDGSTDNSKDIVCAFGDKVRYIWQENKGLAGARNTGVRMAQGELVGLLDADDEWLPDYLKSMLSLISQFPDAAVYYCSAQGMDADGNDLPQVFGGPAIPSEMMYQTLLRANFLIPSTIILKPSLMNKASLFDQKLRHCEDWDLWLRILPHLNIVGTTKCLVRYRLHGNSLSGDASGQQRTTREIIENHFGPDDGQPQNWTADKRRAYGGVYRLYILTSVQRQNDWHSCSRYLYRALYADPTLATDLNLFYDLALGNQPSGYRGTSHHLNLEENAARIGSLLESVFTLPLLPELNVIRHQAFGTAYYAIGLVAYNTKRKDLARLYLFHAIISLPKLLMDRRIVSTLIKSYIPQSFVDFLKRLVKVDVQ